MNYTEVRIKPYPEQFIHMVVAVFYSKSLRGKPRQRRAYAAVRIAKAMLARWGYDWKRSKFWTAERVKQTIKGIKATVRHLKESDKARKRKRYKMILAMYQKERDRLLKYKTTQDQVKKALKYVA